MSALPDQEKQGRATWLAAEDSQLLAERQDLGVLGDLAHPMQPSELDDATDKAIEEAECHGPAELPPNSAWSSWGSGCWTLRGLAPISDARCDGAQGTK